MTSFLKRIVFSGITSLDTQWLKKRSCIEVISPFHHLVSDEPVPWIDKLYGYKNSRQFEADLDWLLRNFRPLSLEQVAEQVQRGQPFPEKGFLICFDDGLRQVYETAAPILLRKGVPAAFFLNPQFVDNQSIFHNFKKGLLLDRFDRMSITPGILAAAGKILGIQLTGPDQLRKNIAGINYLNKQLFDGLAPIFDLDFDRFRQEQKPFMDQAQIRQLIGQGFSVGAHSMDHPLYSLVPLKEQLRQTRESVTWVHERFKPRYRTFAFPHVDTGVSKTFFDELAGPDAPELDLILGNTTAMLEQNPRVVHRFIGENPDIPIDRMVKTVLSYNIARKAINRQYIRRN
ncbi:MAG: polysaccharide deacetylase family protein [Bacteroidetes bacterium]|nr:polysaccharide deacetylase family protein [Bacteroidota bacterium]